MVFLLTGLQRAPSNLLFFLVNPIFPPLPVVSRFKLGLKSFLHAACQFHRQLDKMADVITGGILEASSEGLNDQLPV